MFIFYLQNTNMLSQKANLPNDDGQNSLFESQERWNARLRPFCICAATMKTLTDLSNAQIIGLRTFSVNKTMIGRIAKNKMRSAGQSIERVFASSSAVGRTEELLKQAAPMCTADNLQNVAKK